MAVAKPRKPVTPLRRWLRLAQLGLSLGVLALLVQVALFGLVLKAAKVAGIVPQTLCIAIAVVGCSAIFAAISDAPPWAAAIVGGTVMAFELALQWVTASVEPLFVAIGAGTTLLGVGAAWLVRRRLAAKPKPPPPEQKPVWPPPPPTAPPAA